MLHERRRTPNSGCSIWGQTAQASGEGLSRAGRESGARRGVRPQWWRPSRTIIPSIALVTPARACGTMAAPSLLTRANEVIE